MQTYAQFTLNDEHNQPITVLRRRGEGFYWEFTLLDKEDQTQDGPYPSMMEAVASAMRFTGATAAKVV